MMTILVSDIKVNNLLLDKYMFKNDKSIKYLGYLFYKVHNIFFNFISV